MSETHRTSTIDPGATSETHRTSTIDPGGTSETHRTSTIDPRAMSETHLGNPGRDLLLRLAAGDERSLRAILRPVLEPARSEASAGGPSLDRRTRLLVCLGALLALDASTDSVRWAVDLAGAAGAGEDAVAAVLLATGSAAGSAQLVSSAARLAAALDYETGVAQDWP